MASETIMTFLFGVVGIAVAYYFIIKKDIKRTIIFTALGSFSISWLFQLAQLMNADFLIPTSIMSFGSILAWAIYSIFAVLIAIRVMDDKSDIKKWAMLIGVIILLNFVGNLVITSNILPFSVI